MADDISWDCGGRPSNGLEDCMSKIRDGKEDFVICSRGDDYFQASGTGDGPYYCEAGFRRDDGTYVTYGKPDFATWKELTVLMHRFSQGEDFSFAKDEWEISHNGSKSTSPMLLWVVAGIVVLAVMTIMILKYS